MSRINTNVSSLVAQKILGRTNDQLQESLNRLSTGLRINSGKDDPAGLIASENLRRDITSANKAISNTERADQLIGTADSALGQISNLLNDIRGLVVEAANTGVLSQEQIDANQLQVDSSLEAIDRISQVTTFQGRKLLDGSLDFQLTYSAGGSTVRDLDIQQANLGATGSVNVDVAVSAAATQALISNTSFGAAAPAVQATGTVALTNTAGSITVTAAAGGAADGIVGNTTDVNFAAATDIAQAAGTSTLTPGSIDIAAVAGGAADGVAGNSTQVVYQAATDIAQAAGTLNLTTTGDTINIAAVAGGAADGAAGNIDVQIAEGAGPTSASLAGNVITVNVDNSIVGGDTTANIAAAIAAIGGGGVFTATATSGLANYANADDNTYAATTTGGSDGTTTAAYAAGTITVNVALGATVGQVATAIDGLADFTATATAGGGSAFDTGDFGSTTPLAGGSDGTTTAAYNAGTNVITASVGLNATVTQIATAIDGLADFTASAASGGGNTFDTGDIGPNTDPLTGGVNATTGGLNADLVVKIAGKTGAEVFTFETGATLTQIVNAVNLVSDATGVQAANNAGALDLKSTAYGSSAIVDVEVLNEGTGGTFESALSATRDTGTDIVATVNGVTANGDGNKLSINTSTLDLALTVDDGSSTSVQFTINGGGAVFQLGPQVVSNQQARIGIGSVNTGELGGVDGRLYQLRSGNSADVSTDTKTATRIVDQAINKVTSLRGRLGAFQRTSLETNVASLQDTVSNLVEAESSIRDADFASESAALTRAQILVQSGTAVLSIANQKPQQVLQLLRGL